MGQGSSLTDNNLGMMSGRQVAGQFGVNGIWPVQGFMGKSQIGIDPTLGIGLGLGLGTGLNLITDPNNPSLKIYDPNDPALKGLAGGMLGSMSGAAGMSGGSGMGGGANAKVLGTYIN